jgi:NadR type nicotinamide-nucleotide adenylyltransferase
VAPLTRICLTGPECIGKSTLAERLARELGGMYVPEFAREYVLHVTHDLTADDVGPIAAGQIALEEQRTRDASGPILLDTDLISTVVYARHYYGGCPTWIERAAAVRRADLYLLLDIDVPWYPDPARDRDASARETLYVRFIEVLDEFGAAWRAVSGEWEERYRMAREAIRVQKRSTSI